MFDYLDYCFVNVMIFLHLSCFFSVVCSAAIFAVHVRLLFMRLPILSYSKKKTEIVYNRKLFYDKHLRAIWKDIRCHW